jgi:serine phosphatase RsbU (regulator of sigma subunit)
MNAIDCKHRKQSLDNVKARVQTWSQLAAAPQASKFRRVSAVPRSVEVFPPNAVFRLGRYDVAVRGRPAEPGGRVGGDWYDARLRADGSAVVAIGDVAGHGLGAAAAMMRIGNALRGLAVTELPANSLLSHLNRLICSDECPERVASAIFCVLVQDRPALRWAQAGHPPPVLVSRGMARLLDRPPGLLLGTMPTAAYGLGRHGLAVGDVLFLYTDGLVERRGQDIETGLDALLTAAGGGLGETATDAVNAVLGRLALPPTEDDLCLIAIRVAAGPHAKRAARPTGAATGPGR